MLRLIYSYRDIPGTLCIHSDRSHIRSLVVLWQSGKPAYTSGNLYKLRVLLHAETRITCLSNPVNLLMDIYSDTRSGGQPNSDLQFPTVSHRIAKNIDIEPGSSVEFLDGSGHRIWKDFPVRKGWDIKMFLGMWLSNPLPAIDWL